MDQLALQPTTHPANLHGLELVPTQPRLHRHARSTKRLPAMEGSNMSGVSRVIRMPLFTAAWILDCYRLSDFRSNQAYSSPYIRQWC